MVNDGTADTGGTFWDAIKGEYMAFDAWSGNVFKNIGDALLHPVDSVSSAGSAIVAPIANFAESVLFKVIVILALALVVWSVVKKEVTP